MIIGSCPYVDCAAPLWVSMAESAPQFERHECETCRRTIWTYHSRAAPWSMTEADFLLEYEVDEALRGIRKRGAVE